MKSIISFDNKRTISIIILSLIFVTASPIVPHFLKFAIVFGLFLSLIIDSRKIRSESIVPLLYSVIIFVLSLAQDVFYIYEFGLNTLSLFYIPLSFYLGWLISSRLKVSVFFDIYEKIILYLSILSLIIYFLLMIYPEVISIFFDYSYYDTSHKSLLIYNHVSKGRNSGFASEPGLFQCFVILALWWNLRKNDFGFRTFIYIVTVLSTVSTAGILSLVILVVFRASSLLKLLALAFCLIFSNQVYDIYNYQKEYKLNGSMAFEGREEALVNAINYSVDNPLGIGSVKYTEIQGIEKIGAWDSFGQLLLRYGWIGLIFILLLLIGVSIYDMALAFVLIITLSSQGIWFSPIISFILFSTYRESRSN